MLNIPDNMPKTKLAAAEIMIFLFISAGLPLILFLLQYIRYNQKISSDPLAALLAPGDTIIFSAMLVLTVISKYIYMLWVEDPHIRTNLFFLIIFLFLIVVTLVSFYVWGQQQEQTLSWDLATMTIKSAESTLNIPSEEVNATMLTAFILTLTGIITSVSALIFCYNRVRIIEISEANPND